jgi:ketosteroid isomerase-like protein
MRSAQLAAVRRYHEEGMDRRDLAAVVGAMAPEVGWYSVDGAFQRRWFRGIDEVSGFLAAMFDNVTTFTFHLLRLMADPDVPDAVVAEWENEAVFTDGAPYANRGCTVFVFVPGTDRIAEVRQYFDWGPLMARADWRSSVGENT